LFETFQNVRNSSNKAINISLVYSVEDETLVGRGVLWFLSPREEKIYRTLSNHIKPFYFSFFHGEKN